MSLRVPGLSTLALAAVIVASASMGTACNRAWDELEGNVAFTERDSDGVSVLYISEASGRHREMLFRNTDSTNANILFPKWSKDGKQVLFTAMKNGSWRQMSIEPHTKKVTEGTGTPDNVSRKTRAEDLVVEKGSLFRINKDKTRTQLYRFRNYDSKFNTGVSEASWSPNRTHVIFQVCTMVGGCKLRAARADGSKDFYVGKGASPAWTDLYKHYVDTSHGAKKKKGHGEEKGDKGGH